MVARTGSRVKERLSINVLYPQGTPPKLPIKFLSWFLSYGRLLAIIVELIVVAAFVARFKLDADLSDLKDQNNHQIEFIKGFAGDETRIRQTQFKLQTIKKSYDEMPNWNKLLTHISNQIPVSSQGQAGVKTSSITITHPDNSKAVAFRILGITDSNLNLANFAAGLKQDSYLKNVNLSSISFDSGQITFTITGDAQ